MKLWSHSPLLLRPRKRQLMRMEVRREGWKWVHPSAYRPSSHRDHGREWALSFYGLSAVPVSAEKLAGRKGVVETVKMCPCCLSRCGGLCELESLSSTYCTSAARKTANATKEPYITEIREQHKMRSNHSAHLSGAQKWKAPLLSDLDCATLGFWPLIEEIEE